MNCQLHRPRALRYTGDFSAEQNIVRDGRFHFGAGHYLLFTTTGDVHLLGASASSPNSGVCQRDDRVRLRGMLGCCVSAAAVHCPSWTIDMHSKLPQHISARSAGPNYSLMILNPFVLQRPSSRTLCPIERLGTAGGSRNINRWFYFILFSNYQLI